MITVRRGSMQAHEKKEVNKEWDRFSLTLTLSHHSASFSFFSTFFCFTSILISSFSVAQNQYSSHMQIQCQSVMTTKPVRKARYSASSSSSTSTVTYKFRNDKTTEIPVTSPQSPPIPITVHFHDHSAAAAAKIQAAYRAHTVRRLLSKIQAIKAETDILEQRIQRQETVDAVRSSEKEKLRINEALMSQLLRLDSIPGYDTGVRELRRRLSRRIVALQEVMDGICGNRNETGYYWECEWDEVIGKIEEEVCKERGGDELNSFCAHHLGFRCLQRFLRHP